MSTGVTITLIICLTVSVVWVSTMVAAVYIKKIGKKDESHEDETDLSD